MRVLTWLNRISLVIILCFFFYVLIFFPELSLTYSKAKLVKANATVKLDKEMQEAVDRIIRNIDFTDLVIIAITKAMLLFGVIMLIINLLNFRYLRKIKCEQNIKEDTNA